MESNLLLDGDNLSSRFASDRNTDLVDCERDFVLVQSIDRISVVDAHDIRDRCEKCLYHFRPRNGGHAWSNVGIVAAATRPGVVLSRFVQLHVLGDNHLYAANVNETRRLLHRRQSDSIRVRGPDVQRRLHRRGNLFRVQRGRRIRRLFHSIPGPLKVFVCAQAIDTQERSENKKKKRKKITRSTGEVAAIDQMPPTNPTKAQLFLDEIHNYVYQHLLTTKES
mmetsp:Transcript_23295/g.51828  ORF Transcript_23295/g.51828 Transcript_23295/m.51828 type:complete len:223 (-) Transcript_23295:37-705(-)